MRVSASLKKRVRIGNNAGCADVHSAIYTEAPQKCGAFLWVSRWQAVRHVKLAGYATSPNPMLQKLRDKTSGWIATVILGLLIIPFAFFGMESYLQQRVATYAARIAQPPSWWRSAPEVWPLTYLWSTHEIDTNEFRQRFEIARMRAR